MLCDLLTPTDRVKSKGDWRTIFLYLLTCQSSEITNYALYLALAQEVTPVPIYVLDQILQGNADLMRNNDSLHQMYCELAYHSDHTPFVTIKHLLDASNGMSFELADALLRQSLRADFRRYDVARELIRYEPSVLLHRDEVGNMLIHQCCIYCESPAMAQLLVDEGLSLMHQWLPRNHDGMTAIDIASYCENIEGVRGILSILLHSSPEFPSKAEVVEYGLLHVACRVDDTYYARRILELYPELIHTIDNENFTPLHVACLHALPTTIQLFLDEELRIGVQSSVTSISKINHFTPIQLACMNPRTNQEVIKSLMKSNPESDPPEMIVWKFKLLHIAAIGANLNIAKYFIEIFPPALTMTSNTGCLPIRLACSSGSADMVDLLITSAIDLGFDAHSALLLHKADNYIESPIQLACSNSLITARVLKRMFDLVGIRTREVLDGNLLNRAISSTNLECAKLILSYWPQTLHQTDEHLNLPLHLACRSGNTQLTRFIFRKSIQKLFLDQDHYIHVILSSTIYRYNRSGITPWDLLCNSFSSLLELYGNGAFANGTWPCIKFVLNLKAVLLRWRPTGILPIYQAAIITIPNSSMLGAVILTGNTQSDPRTIDNKGRTAIHAIAEQQPLNQGTRRDIIEYLLREEHGASCAFMKDFDGNLPLHIAAANGLTWLEGMDCIFHANVLANNEVDATSGFYPFLLASTCPHNLDAVYQLLRLNPNLLG